MQTSMMPSSLQRQQMPPEDPGYVAKPQAGPLKRKQNSETYGLNTDQNLMPMPETPQMQFPKDAEQMIREPFEAQMGMAGQAEQSLSGLKSAQGERDRIAASHDYDPSILRKILGIGAGIMTMNPLAGLQTYDAVTQMPRQKALKIQDQKMAGMTNIQKAASEVGAEYGEAGKTATAGLGAIANADQNRVAQFGNEVSMMPTFTQHEMADPETGANVMGSFPNKVVGPFSPDRPLSGPKVSPKVEIKTGLDPNNNNQSSFFGVDTSQPNPQAMPLPGIGSPPPSSGMEGYFSGTPDTDPKTGQPAKRSGAGLQKWMKDITPVDPLVNFTAEQRLRDQSQTSKTNEDAKIHNAAQAYYEGQKDPIKAKAAARADQNLTPDQKQRVYQEIDKLHGEKLRQMPDMLKTMQGLQDGQSQMPFPAQ